MTEVGLRDLLNEWDPIGVADVAHDEYDCLIEPLLSMLAGGARRAEIAEYLRSELRDHFGLDPAHHDIDVVAARTVSAAGRSPSG